MSMVKALPQRVGAIMLADGRVGNGEIPMFGIQDLQLARSANWSSEFGPQAMAVHMWNGSMPLCFNFNFTLTAGVHVRSRQELQKHVKAAHAMVSHVMNGDKVEAPPKCRLIMGEMISTTGFVTEIACNGQAPWATTSDNFPTTVIFTGTFMSSPGYDGKMVSVQRNNGLDAAKILSSGYVG